ncbi:DUF2231 domain-containing protein [Heyndrickxia coagulans]|uniref:DUF2231 domain-containing protein n=1 Tax=Heyndrickxia coagulans TaxID=1398 RepID=A0AAW7CD56_HEYCO|nr:DUF2231 domain-containing protein [Heyndrickxia coagulans]MDL5041637.1 hypothetical protein [Heyndrickxia coagulans]
MGTPIHPLLVHFPIALLIFGVIFQFVALWKKEFFNKMALYLFGSGFVMGIASYMTGDSAIPDAREKWGQAVHSMVETHEHYALITMAIFGAVLFFKLLPVSNRINGSCRLCLSCALLAQPRWL